jgi:hypothetical protein
VRVADCDTVRGMPGTFAASLESWHDFYLAVGSASAALLGLLFVGVSISVSSVAAAERLEVTTRANLAFSNLLYLLGLSLVILMPGVEAGTVAISFAVIACLGLLRILRRLRPFAEPGRRRLPRWDTLRRVAWTVVADLFVLWIAVEIGTTGDGRWLLATPVVVLVLLLGAADVAWDLLAHGTMGS